MNDNCSISILKGCEKIRWGVDLRRGPLKFEENGSFRADALKEYQNMEQNNLAVGIAH